MEHGLSRLDDGLPLSNRLLLEIHARLLATGRGSRRMPGEFRRSQNWIGGTRPGNAHFVPPPDHAGLSYTAAAAAMRLLVDLDIAEELTGRQRDRLFGYREYIAILHEGTEL